MELSPQEGPVAFVPPQAPSPPTSVPQVQAPPYHLICLDRSKNFSTVHGDRHPIDPQYKVAYCQNGLPFDVNDKLVPDDGRREAFRGPTSDGKETMYSPLYDDNMRRLVTRRLERLMKHGAKYAPEPEAEVDPEETVPDIDLVNLASWLKGDVEYPDSMITRAVREKHHKNVLSPRQAVEFLSFEMKPPLVHPRMLGKKLLALVDKG